MSISRAPAQSHLRKTSRMRYLIGRGLAVAGLGASVTLQPTEMLYPAASHRSQVPTTNRSSSVTSSMKAVLTLFGTVRSTANFAGSFCQTIHLRPVDAVDLTGASEDYSRVRSSLWGDVGVARDCPP